MATSFQSWQRVLDEMKLEARADTVAVDEIKPPKTRVPRHLRLACRSLAIATLRRSARVEFLRVPDVERTALQPARLADARPARGTRRRAARSTRRPRRPERRASLGVVRRSVALLDPPLRDPLSDQRLREELGVAEEARGMKLVLRRVSGLARRRVRAGDRKIDDPTDGWRLAHHPVTFRVALTEPRAHRLDDIELVDRTRERVADRSHRDHASGV